MSYFDDYEFDRFYEEEKQIQRIERNFTMNDLTRVTTGEVRLSYVHLFKPYANEPGQEEKYSVTVLVPKTDVNTMARINAAIEAAKQIGISDKWGGTCPPIIPTPVYDGDGVKPSDGMPFGPECKGPVSYTHLDVYKRQTMPLEASTWVTEAPAAAAASVAPPV